MILISILRKYEEMPSILKQDKRSVLKKRNVSHLSVKIENVQENKVSFAETTLLERREETRNDSYFESVWPGKLSWLFFFLQEN